MVRSFLFAEIWISPQSNREKLSRHPRVTSAGEQQQYDAAQRAQSSGGLAWATQEYQSFLVGSLRGLARGMSRLVITLGRRNSLKRERREGRWELRVAASG